MQILAQVLGSRFRPVAAEAAGICFDEAVAAVVLGSESENCPVQVK